MRFEFDRSIAAFRGDVMVGVVSAYSFELTVPGGVAATTGSSWLAVLPTHRRRGLGRRLQLWRIANAQDRGDVLQIGVTAQGGTHGRFGWAPAATWMSRRIQGGKGTLRSDAPRDPLVQVRITEPGKVGKALAEIYRNVTSDRPGSMARTSQWWSYLLRDPVYVRRGLGPLMCVIAEAQGVPRGYALYRGQLGWDDDGIAAGQIEIVEFMASDAATCTALWANLLERDLVSEVRAAQRPPDDPLLHLLADPRQARAHARDGLWMRILNVGKALTQRQYSTSIDVVLDISDDGMPSNNGRWHPRVSDDGRSAACAPTTESAEVALTIGALSATYLGGVRLGALAAAGLAREIRPGALAALSTALSWDPAPRCPISF